MCKHEQEADYCFLFKSTQKCLKQIYNADFKPTCLVADGATAITNGFIAAFGAIEKRVSCWYHMISLVDDNLKHVKEFAVLLRRDIEQLQLCSSPRIFDKAVALFFKKWRSKKNKEVDTFLDYFYKQHIQHLPGWYEGYAEGMPSTDNALESCNGRIKAHSTFRRLCPLEDFLYCVDNDIVRNWSLDYNPGDEANPNVNVKSFSIEPHIKLSDYDEASKWMRSGFNCIQMRSIYFVPGSGCLKGKIVQQDVDKFRENQLKLSWKSFDKFVVEQSSIHFLTLNEANWKLSKCSCPWYAKNMICKHVIALCAQFKIGDCKIPLESATLPLDQNRKRGRIPKATLALQRMTVNTAGFKK